MDSWIGVAAGGIALLVGVANSAVAYFNNRSKLQYDAILIEMKSELRHVNEKATGLTAQCSQLSKQIDDCNADRLDLRKKLESLDRLAHKTEATQRMQHPEFREQGNDPPPSPLTWQ